MTVAAIRRRWLAHIRYAIRNKPLKNSLQEALLEHGHKAFSIVVICEVADKNTACLAEIDFIASEQTLAPAGYNLTPGGECGFRVGHRHSPESRAKMSAAALGKPKSPEAIARMAAAMKGRKMSPKRLALNKEIGLRNKGQKRSPKTIIQLRVNRRKEALKTGSAGVEKLASGNFRTRISCEGKMRRLGTYPTYEEAKAVYDVAAAEHLAALLQHAHDPTSLMPAQKRYADDLTPYDSARRTKQRKKDWIKRRVRSQQNQGTLL